MWGGEGKGEGWFLVLAQQLASSQCDRGCGLGLCFHIFKMKKLNDMVFKDFLLALRSIFPFHVSAK